jgi:hypothetical protein
VFVAPYLGGTGVYDYVANKVADFDMVAQLTSQLWAVGTAVVLSGGRSGNYSGRRLGAVLLFLSSNHLQNHL